MVNKIFDYVVLSVILMVGMVYWSNVFHRAEQQTVTVVEKSALPDGVAINELK